MTTLPKIFVFCNRQNCKGSGNWHSMRALAEDGTALAGHFCSSHGFAKHDMGILEDGWKRDLYAKHYPNGFDVEWVEDPMAHAGVLAALKNAKPLPDEQRPGVTVEFSDGTQAERKF